MSDINYYKPTLDSIKGGAVLAERSRVVLYIWNLDYMKQAFVSDTEDEVEEEDDSRLPIIDVKVVKNNRGKVGGIVNYVFDGSFFRFTPLKK